MFPESVILVVGGGSEESDSIANMLSDRYRVIGVEKAEEAISYVTDGVDLVIGELDSSDYSGLQLLRTWKSHDRRTPIIFLTDGRNVSAVVEAMKLGAADCLVKPVNAATLRAAVAQVVNANSLAEVATACDVTDVNGHRPNIDIPPGTSLEDLERAAVEQALAQHQGNRTHAARTLGISVRTLQRKLKAWGIPVVSLHSNGPGNSFLFTEHDEPLTSHSPFSAHAH